MVSSSNQSIRTRGAEGGGGDVSKGDERLHGEQQQRRHQRGRQVPQRPLQRAAAALALVHRHHHRLPLLRRRRGHRRVSLCLRQPECSIDLASLTISPVSGCLKSSAAGLSVVGASVAWLLELGGCAGQVGEVSHMAATRRAEQTFVDPHDRDTPGNG